MNLTKILLATAKINFFSFLKRDQFPYRLILALLLIQFALLISGCASVGQMPKTNGAQTITVIAYGKDEIQLQHVGTTAFNNVRSSELTPGWEFQKKLTKIAVSQLDKAKSFASVQEGNEGLARELVGIRPAWETQVWAVGQQKQKIEKAADFCKTDYAIVITPWYGGDFISATNQRLEEYGIHQRGMVGLTDRAYAYITLKGLLIDCKAKAEAFAGTSRSFKPVSFQLSKERNLKLDAATLIAAQTAVEEEAVSAVASLFSNMEMVKGK